ncbi:MAG: response regulator transcription factor, partial [Bacteroidetes bacterium]|nr:response regulator transcription factor [Bacteroidota bacterium]
MITKREKEIIREVAEGLSTKEIADKLYISERTVETHRKNIIDKLGLN